MIAIASGKGGTGKTTVAVALARTIRRTEETEVDLIDCDVEAPNARLFFSSSGARGRQAWEQAFSVQRPSVDVDRCTGCGRCVDFCGFGALARVGGEVLVFPELCHACGGCAVVCPESAIVEEPSVIGTIRESLADGIHLVEGELAIGQTLTPPLIREAKSRGRIEAEQVVDSAPGTTCPVVAAIKGAEFVVLVTENSPFGTHDLALAVDVVRQAGIAHGAVINRSDLGPSDEAGAREFCRRENIEVLLEIPFDPAAARTYAEGGSILDAGPAYPAMFEELLQRVRRRIGAPV